MTASASTKVTELLIDGELVGAGGGTFTTINPATEEPLGDAADADAADMDRAIAAARAAFDESDWSRDTALRVHCLRQLRDALNEEIETLREITVAEVGAPVQLTRAAQLQGPVDDLAFPADLAENVRVDHRPRCRVADGHQDQTHHRARGRRRRRSRHAVELPAPDQLRQARASAGRRQHRRVEAGAGHPVVCGRSGPNHRGEDRHSRRRRQHRHVQRPPRRCATGRGPARGSGVVHRFHRHRTVRHGRGIADDQEGLPGTRWQVGLPGARRRRAQRRLRDGGVHRGHARRAGLRHHHAAGGAARTLRRGRRRGRRHDGRPSSG